MTKGLLFSGESGQFRYYEEVIARLKDYKVYVDICCDRDDPGIFDLLSNSAQHLGVGFWYHDGDAAIPKQSLLERCLEAAFFFKLKSNSIYRESVTQLNPTLLVQMIRFHRYRFLSAKRAIVKSGAEVVLVPEDGIGGNYWAVASALCLGRMAVVLPFGMGDSSSLLYRGVEEKHARGELCYASTPKGSVIERYWPQWFRDSSYGPVALVPPEFIAAMEFADIHLPRPWILQGGCAHAILVEGESMKRRYLAEEIPESKLVDAGTIYCDLLYEGLGRTGKDDHWLRKGCKHNARKLKILVCVPPGEGDFWIARSEFNSIAEYCRALVELCDEDSNFEITFSFHPRLLPADLERLAAAGILSDAESVVKLIPSYDVLVGSFSSVARWGLVSRRPTIDFDLFGFGLPRFRDCAGYLYCKKFDEVKTLLFKLRNDDEFFRQVSLGCASVADGFDKLDGSAARKLANSIKALTNPAINK